MAVLLLLCEWEEKWTLPTQSLLNFRYSVSDNLGFSQQCDRLSDFFFSDVLESVSFLCVIFSVPGIAIAKLEGKWIIGVEWRNAHLNIQRNIEIKA